MLHLAKTTEEKINRKATRVGTFEVCVATYVPLRMFIMQVLASQLHFLTNRNAELAVPPLHKNRGKYVALLNSLTIYTLYCGKFVQYSDLRINLKQSPHNQTTK